MPICGGKVRSNIMCLIHKWSKWEAYDHHYKFFPGKLAPTAVQGMRFTATDLRQRRICSKCGKMQDELVQENISLKEAI